MAEKRAGTREPRPPLSAAAEVLPFDAEALSVYDGPKTIIVAYTVIVAVIVKVHVQVAEVTVEEIVEEVGTVAVVDLL